MNLVTIPIYNRFNPDESIHSSAIQLAITSQVNQLVLNKFGDHNRAKGAISVTSSGKIIFGSDVHYAMEHMVDQSHLLDSIRSWNNKYNTNIVELDATTVTLAKQIQLQFAHPSGNQLLTQANIAAHIPTECDKAVMQLPQLVSNNVQLLVDNVSGLPLYLKNSNLGHMIIDHIHQSMIDDDCSYPTIHIIQAPQGAGKSKFLSALITDVNELQRKVVCLSPRQQLIKSAYDDILGTSSIDAKDILVGASTKTLKRIGNHTVRRPSDEYAVTLTTINSMKSIWKVSEERVRRIKRLDDQKKIGKLSQAEYDDLRSELDEVLLTSGATSFLPNKDLIIYDEFQLLRSSIVSGTHIDHDDALDIRRNMYHLQRKANTIVVLDADIDASVVEFFATNHPDSKIHVHRFVLPEDREIQLHFDNKSLERWFIDQIKYIVPKRVSGSVSSSFAVPCTCTKFGRHLESIIRQMRSDLNVIWIESKNKDLPEQQALLDDDPSRARNYDIIIYSPKIFTGFSFDPINVDGELMPVAKCVVGFFSGKKINWMERAQSLFRIRNCREFHFSIVGELDADMILAGDIEHTTIDHVREERLKLFDCRGIYTPTPKHEYDNGNLILYFRARGFQIHEHPGVDVQEVDESIYRDHTNDTTNQPVDQSTLALDIIQPFITLCGVTELSGGRHLLFSGKLQGEFCELIDQMFNEHPTTLDIIRKLLPKWKRHTKHDMIVTNQIYFYISASLFCQEGLYAPLQDLPFSCHLATNRIRWFCLDLALRLGKSQAGDPCD